MKLEIGEIVKIKKDVEHVHAGSVGRITDIEDVFEITNYIVRDVAFEIHELEAPTESEIKIFLEIEKIRG